MKKFKNFILFCILSALCILSVFALTGCNSRGYIEDSFDYKIETGFYSSYTVSGKFKVRIENDGEYKVTYTVKTTGPCGNQQNEEHQTVSATIEGGEEYIIYVESIFYSSNNEANNTAKITNVRITKIKTKFYFAGYAIGFGIVGGAMLVTVVTLFVLGKKDN